MKKALLIGGLFFLGACSVLKEGGQPPVTLSDEEKVGQTFKVLIDKKEGDFFVGRTQYDSPEVDNEVLIDASKHYVPVGSFTEISIDRAEDFDLYGHPKS